MAGTQRPSQPDEATRHVVEVGAALNHRLVAIVAAMRRALAERITELNEDPALIDLLGASIEGNVDNILHGFQHGIAAAQMEPPSAAYEYARRLAQRGVPVNALVRAYRLGQQFLLQQAFAESARITVGDDGVRVAAHDAMVETTFAYIDWISQRVVTVYEDERESWLANRVTTRAAEVEQVLAGGDLDVDVAERVTGYWLRGRHVAVVAWVDEPSALQDQLNRFEATVRTLTHQMGSRRKALVIGRDRATVWAWISVPEHYVHADSMDRCRPGGDELPVPRLALGSAQSGLEGFRRSHHEALAVHHLAALDPRHESALMRYDADGVSIAAVMAQQPDVARDWVRSVLGELVRDTEANTRHRATLLSFLRHGGSYTATAEAMVMHKNSIKYRVVNAEKALGRPVADDRLTIEVALTVCHWMGSAALFD